MKRPEVRQRTNIQQAAGMLGLLVLLCFSVRSERLPLKSYTTADGLAHNVINKIVRDSRGFLWFCTADGLSRFDGYTFTNFGTSRACSMPTSPIFLRRAAANTGWRLT